MTFQSLLLPKNPNKAIEAGGGFGQGRDSRASTQEDHPFGDVWRDAEGL